MQADKNRLLFLIPSTLILLISGCSITPKPVEVAVLPDFSQVPSSYSVAKRFDEPTTAGPTAVDSAIELSQKYAELSEQAAGLRQKNEDLVAENHRLKTRVAALDNQLEQAQRELTEATGLLRELIIELNNWKTDVIGFRNEMRAAETTQLRALLDILKVLGGEVGAEDFRDEQGPVPQKTTSANDKETGPVAASSTVPSGTQLQESAIMREWDE